MNTRPHVGSSLDDLLAKDGTLEEVTARALKRVIARQLSHEMKAQSSPSPRWPCAWERAVRNLTGCSIPTPTQ